MSIFTHEKARDVHCVGCMTETIHVKRAPHYDVHFLAMWFTMFFWTPITIGAALLDWWTPFRCAVCGRAAARDTVPSGESTEHLPEGASPTPQEVPEWPSAPERPVVIGKARKRRRCA